MVCVKIMVGVVQWVGHISCGGKCTGSASYLDSTLSSCG